MCLSVPRYGAAAADVGCTARPCGLGPELPGPSPASPDLRTPQGPLLHRAALQSTVGGSGASRPVAAPSCRPSGSGPALGNKLDARVNPTFRPPSLHSRRRGERPSPGTPRGSQCRGVPAAAPGFRLGGGCPALSWGRPPEAWKLSPLGPRSLGVPLQTGRFAPGDRVCHRVSHLLRGPGAARLGGERWASPPAAAGPRARGQAGPGFLCDEPGAAGRGAGDSVVSGQGGEATAGGARSRPGAPAAVGARSGRSAAPPRARPRSGPRRSRHRAGTGGGGSRSPAPSPARRVSGTRAGYPGCGLGNRQGVGGSGCGAVGSAAPARRRKGGSAPGCRAGGSRGQDASPEPGACGCPSGLSHAERLTKVCVPRKSGTIEPPSGSQVTSSLIEIFATSPPHHHPLRSSEERGDFRGGRPEGEDALGRAAVPRARLRAPPAHGSAPCLVRTASRGAFPPFPGVA